MWLTVALKANHGLTIFNVLCMCSKIRWDGWIFFRWKLNRASERRSRAIFRMHKKTAFCWFMLRQVPNLERYPWREKSTVQVENHVVTQCSSDSASSLLDSDSPRQYKTGSTKLPWHLSDLILPESRRSHDDIQVQSTNLEMSLGDQQLRDA